MVDTPDSEPIGECDSCPNVGVLTLYGKLNLCAECHAKELQTALNHQAPEKQEERLQAHQNVENIHLQHIRDENAAIRISSDIFNAKIRSISELKKEIDADSTIENKNFTIARVLNERFTHLNSILHDKRAEISDAVNEQYAIQTYYNELSKRLRAEEREKIKLSDLTYKPLEVIAKVKKVTAPKKYDKTGIAAQALLSGINEVLIQMTCVARDITPEAAVMILKEQGIGKK